MEKFLSTCAAQNPNRRLRLIALADRVSMKVERADFDDLVTLVAQAPPWEKDRAAGVRILLRAIGEGKPDAPDQILARWTWRLSRAVRKQLDRKASQEYPAATRLLGALANSRGHRHEENAAKLVNAALEMPREVGAALLASAEGYTPRATQLLEAARERLGSINEVAGWIADNLPQPKTGPSRTRRRRRRKKKGPETAVAAATPEAGAETAAPAHETGETPAETPPPKKPRNIRRLRASVKFVDARPSRHRAAGRRRHGPLAVRAAGAADPARGRRIRTQADPRDRGARSELQRVHAVRDLDPRPARAAAGLPAQPGDRVPVRARGDPARAAAGARRRAAARGVFPPSAEGRREWRVPVRRDARTGVRSVRRARPRNGPGRRREQQPPTARDHSGAGLRGRRRDPDARDRVRRP